MGNTYLVLSGVHKTKFCCLEEEANINSQRKVSRGASITPNKSFNCPLGSDKLAPSLNTLNGIKVPARKLV